MERQLTPDQIKLVIAEVQELDLASRQEMTAAEVREILHELNLPGELLEDAMVQIDRRQALAAQKRRQRWILGGAIGVIIACATLYGIATFNQQQALNKITVQTSRIALSLQDRSNPTEIDRQTNSKVFYQLTLDQAPIGQSLSLSCNWIDPNGQIAHQNKFQTKTIATSVWQTHCQQAIGLDTVPGNWQVQAFLGTRTLGSSKFTLR
jgi:hypothetical protein